MVETLRDFGVMFLGVRPLENGRLALSYYNKKTKKEEVRVYDLWVGFESRRNDPLCEKWFNISFFKTLYYYKDCVCWNESMTLPVDDLYVWSELVEGKFQCLV